MLPTLWQHAVGTALLAVSTAFLLVPVGGCIPIPKPKIIGLKPESPEVVTYTSQNIFFTKRESPVDQLRPTFRWEQFPRPADLTELGPDADERITAVHYELRLWKVGPGFSGDFERPDTSFWIGSAEDYKYSWSHECRDSDPGELVYRKQGLTMPEHRLESSLEPDSRYFWTVRAHFKFDGKLRVTEWSEQFLLHPHYVFQTWPDGCSSPVIFHLIRTP